MRAAGETHRATIGSCNTANNITQGGLAGAIRADKGVYFAFFYAEVDAAQNGRGITLMQSGD
jgi:hypothetical protein